MAASLLIQTTIMMVVVISALQDKPKKDAVKSSDA
jgi:hypothetical protein